MSTCRCLSRIGKQFGAAAQRKRDSKGGVELQMLLAPNCGKSMRFAATEQVEQRADPQVFRETEGAE